MEQNLGWPEPGSCLRDDCDLPLRAGQFGCPERERVFPAPHSRSESLYEVAIQQQFSVERGTFNHLECVWGTHLQHLLPGSARLNCPQDGFTSITVLLVRWCGRPAAGDSPGRLNPISHTVSNPRNWRGSAREIPLRDGSRLWKQETR